MTAIKSTEKARGVAMSGHTDQACENTDRELWRGPDEGNGAYYADSIHVTQSGGIGINCGGMVYVKPLREWHRLASSHAELVKALEPFAKLADHYPTFKDTLTFGFGRHVVTLADCRAANAALATLTARKVG